MGNRMKKTVLAKRLFAFLLAGSMIFGELGSMPVYAQEFADVQEAGPADVQEAESADVQKAEQAADPEEILQDPTSEEKTGEQPPAEDTDEALAESEKQPDSEEQKPEDTDTASPAGDGFTEIVEEEAEVSPKAEGTLEAPSNLRVYGVGSSWGDVTLHWDYDIDPADTSYSFEVYRSETRDGEYEKMSVDTWNEIDTDHTFGAYVPVLPNPETGNVKKYYFKVKAIHTETDGTRTESVFSEIVENEEVVQGIGYGTGYKGICFLEDGKPVEILELHVGETKKLGLGLIKEDGTVVPMKSLKSKLQVNDPLLYYSTEWRTGFISSFETMEWVEEDSGEYADVEFSMEDDVLRGYEQYVTADKLLEAGREGQYFLEVETQCNSVFGFYLYRVPIRILAAEEGVTYEKGFTPAHICQTKEEAYAYAREIQRSRSKGAILVEEGVFNQSNIYRALNPEEIYDTYAERIGMKPDEGDYIFYHIGDLSKKSGEVVMIDGYKYEKLKAGGIYYDVYTFSGPYLTTRAQENRVDAKIRELLSTGELSGVYQTGSETQKAEAIASYVNSHVTYKGTTDPQYHTCYSALIDGIGTCEAYSLLYMRLAREMGLPSKIVGTTLDASGNSHAFNIVKADGKWYHIDALGDCKLHTGRPGAALAEPYLDQRYINNYLSKIPGSGYQYVSSGTVTIEDDLGEREECSSLSAARDRVKELAKGNQDRRYRVLISKNMQPDDLDALDFGEAAERVTIDLGGHTIKIIDMSRLDIRAARVTNGKITIGTEAFLALLHLANGAESVYDHLSVSWKQTTSGIQYSENRWMVQVQNGYGDIDNPGKVCLEDTVTFSSNLYQLDLNGSVEVKGNLKATGMYLYGDVRIDGNVTADMLNVSDGVRIDGNVTAKKLMINGERVSDEKEVYLNGTVKVTERFICQDDITVKGDWDISGYSAFGGPTPVTVTIEGSLSLSGTTAAFDDREDGYFGSYQGPSVVKVVKKYDEKRQPLSQGELSVSGSLKLPKEQEPPFDMGEEKRIFDIRPEVYVGDKLQEDARFEKGDMIARLSIQKILDGNGRNLGALHDGNLKDYITCGPIDPEGTLELDETSLLVSTECVRVSYGEGDTKVTAAYSSLKKAVAGLDTLAAKAAGTYTFTFVDNGIFTKSLTLPSYVTCARFEAEGEAGQQLDFKGYTLTTAGDLAVDDSLYLLSSGKAAGTIVLTKSNIKAGAADTEDEIPTFTFLTGRGGCESPYERG